MDPDKRFKGKRKLGEMSRKMGIWGRGSQVSGLWCHLQTWQELGLQNNVPESAGSALFQGRVIWR